MDLRARYSFRCRQFCDLACAFVGERTHFVARAAAEGMRNHRQRQLWKTERARLRLTQTHKCSGKIIVDTYGGAAPHGGGAFSGKDPSKVDRSAAYAARYVAKNIVAAGIAQKCLVQVAYAIGVAKPVSLMVTTFGTGKIDDEKIVQLIEKHFDLRPKGIVQSLNLLRPIYTHTASYGHFGRDEPDFTWETTDKAEALRADAGL